jgi:HEPN domain-containing protein
MPHSDTSPEYWYELARDDEESARILIRESAAPDIAAYHLHQAVEKTLKGIIAGKGAEVPRIHDLERLFLKAQSLGAELAESAFDAIALIQSYYSDFRYPRGDRLGPADLERISKAFGDLEKLRKDS